MSNHSFSAAIGQSQRNLGCNSPQQDINVLILGQTGVGKTTFVNAFVNHLVYDSLEKALIGELFSVTSATFFLHDVMNGATRKIDFGETDSNEQFSDKGYSATQGCQSYVFSIGNRKLRLIDAPGIGDTRGPIQDATNFEHIVDYISQYQYLNGICILLKPNEERLNVLFNYCFKELLTHLHRSAAENIMFVFTNGRSTDYGPGATSMILPNLLKEISEKTNADIPFSEDNTFFLDNEGFRFLVASKKGMVFGRNQLESNAKSWKKSSRGYIRLFSSTCNKFPHELQETISINAAQQHIRKLTRLLAEIVRLTAENIKLVENFKGQSIRRIEQRIGRFVPLDLPRTVCTSETCTRVTIRDGQLIVDYFQHCHTKCYLRKVDEEVIRHPKLRRCKAMNRDTGETNCSSRFFAI